MTTDIEILVAADSDVPLHTSDAAHVFLTGQDLGIGYFLAAAKNLAFAARFRDVPIPRGARIRSAIVRLEASTSQAEVKVRARIDGLLVANSSTPTHAEFDGGAVGATGHGRIINLRTRAQALWINIAATTAGVDFDTPDLSLVAQEIISLAEWVEGNALTLFIGDEDQESDAVDGHFRDALRSGVGPRLVVSFDVSTDPAIFQVSLGAMPQTLPRQTAEALKQDTQAQVE
jgi:hypothetical protein